MLNRLLDPEGSKLPKLADLAPQIGAEVQRLAALTLPQLGSEVMSKAFTADYDPSAAPVELGQVTGSFIPDYQPPRLNDVDPPEVGALSDLLAEGVQVLERAMLIRPAFAYSGAVAGTGWSTTRVGRMALSQGTVETLLKRLTPQ